MHFAKLTDAIPSAVQRRLKAKTEDAYELLHNVVPGKFRVSRKLIKNSKYSHESNNISFLTLFKLFLKENEVLSFSFVRHPFERYDVLQ